MTAPHSPPPPLLLFVDVESELGLRALRNLKAFLAKALPPAIQFEVVDVFLQPEVALQARVLATPCLMTRRADGRWAKLIGDLSDLSLLEAFLERSVHKEARTHGGR